MNKRRKGESYRLGSIGYKTTDCSNGVDQETPVQCEGEFSQRVIESTLRGSGKVSLCLVVAPRGEIV